MTSIPRGGVPTYLQVMDSPAAERRQARRYPMEVPVTAGPHEGITRDVSSRGVYFLSRLDAAVGQEVALNVTLPPSSPMGNLPLSLRARIVRRSDFGDERGLAVEILAWEVSELS